MGRAQNLMTHPRIGDAQFAEHRRMHLTKSWKKFLDSKLTRGMDLEQIRGLPDRRTLLSSEALHFSSFYFFPVMRCRSAVLKSAFYDVLIAPHTTQRKSK